MLYWLFHPSHNPLFWKHLQTILGRGALHFLIKYIIVYAIFLNRLTGRLIFSGSCPLMTANRLVISSSVGTVVGCPFTRANRLVISSSVGTVVGCPFTRANRFAISSSDGSEGDDGCFFELESSKI